jgi:hypothetical protein
MGMFDTFEAEVPLECECGHKWIPQDGVQSKHFDCTLEFFHVGDVLSGARKKYYSDYDWCPACREQVDLMLGFNDEIFMGVFQSEHAIDVAIKKFDLITEYKRARIAHKENDAILSEVFYTIKEIIEFNTTPTKKQSKFAFLTRIRVSDYNPITALKNLLKEYQED